MTKKVLDTSGVLWMEEEVGSFPVQTQIGLKLDDALQGTCDRSSHGCDIWLIVYTTAVCHALNKFLNTMLLVYSMPYMYIMCDNKDTTLKLLLFRSHLSKSLRCFKTSNNVAALATSNCA